MSLLKVLAFSSIFFVQNAALFEKSIDRVSNALLYLYKFGYIEFNEMNTVLGSEDFLNGPIADFQAFAGINVTGELDEETVGLMNTPRFIHSIFLNVSIVLL